MLTPRHLTVVLVLIAVPSSVFGQSGATGGIGARQHAMEFGVADIEAQVADLRALADHARSLDSADRTRQSVVVSLDGSIGFAERVPTYLALAGWRPGRMRAPLLHLGAPAEERKDLSALEALTVPVRIETVPRAVHHDFTILGPLSAYGLAIPALGLDDSDGDELHAAILRATVAFLEEHRPSGID